MKRSAWSSGSFNPENPLAISRPAMKSSKRSDSWGLVVAARQRRVSAGYAMMKVGWISFGSATASKQFQLQRGADGVGLLGTFARRMNMFESVALSVKSMPPIRRVFLHCIDHGQAVERVCQNRSRARR